MLKCVENSFRKNTLMKLLMSSVTVEVIEELIDSGVSDFVSNGGSLPDVIAMSRETLDKKIRQRFFKGNINDYL